MKLNDRRVLFGSVRLLKDRLVFTSVPGRGEEINWEELFVFDVRREVLLDRYIAQDSLWENISIFTCRGDSLLSVDEVEIEVRYRLLVERFIVPRYYEPPCKLAMMTLFWPDKKLLPGFLAHYVKLGVERFYLYANKKLTPEDRRELTGLAKGYEDNVHFVQFEHSYYSDSQLPSRHYGQMMAINDFLYWSHDFAQFILLTDLDEFLYLSAPLKLKPQTCYSFYSCVARYTTPIKFEGMVAALSSPLAVAKVEDGRRCKSLFSPATVAVSGQKMKALKDPPRVEGIVPPHLIPATGVHRPKTIIESATDTFVSRSVGYLCHVSNYVERPRAVDAELTAGGFQEVVLSNSASFEIND
jgi:hypothetical protein